MTPARIGALCAGGVLALSGAFVAVACGGGSAAAPVHQGVATADAEVAPPVDAGGDATPDGAGDATPDAPAAVEAGPGISARGFHTCSIRNGTVKCWGANYFGELGNGTHTDQPSPTPTTVTGITGGAVHGVWHGCGFAGAVPRCWGANSNDELGHDQGPEVDAGAGDGSAGVWFMRPSTSVPAPLPGLSGAVAFALGDGYSCALSSQGTVSCWGADLSGVLGDTPSDGGMVCVGATGGPCAAAPRAIPSLTGVSQISAAESATACGLRADKTVWCWGDNQYGLLGQSAPDGGASVDTAAHPTPVQVQGLQGVTQIASGDNHRCALLSGGAVWCWGYNYLGQLGRDPASDPSCSAMACVKTPAAVAGLANVREIGLGEGFGCAVQTDDTVLCWGQNGAGQLGRDPAADGGVPGYTPQAVAGLSNVAHIAVGATHACALKRDDNVVCWGDNGNGELGPGVDGGKTFTPVAVPGL